MAKEPKVVEAPEGTTLYKLKRPFWDGRVRHDRGTEVRFVKGEQPKSAVELDKDGKPVKATPEV